ncbi:MAG: HEAT repeat domain-containing protein [Anaerolineae bacterium]|jgi:HEAT repeat protein|nr:HEAT repeat domain-containing protein [Anaerolineae bacterium]
MTYSPDTVAQAFNHLRHGSPEARASAIKLLGEAAYAPAVPHLTELVRDADPGTRYLAAMALSKIGDEAESAVPVLLVALRADDMYLRMAITAALISIGQPAVPGLVKALFDQKAAVRRASAKALGKIGNKDAINALKVAAFDADPGVSRLAAEALTRLEAL